MSSLLSFDSIGVVVSIYLGKANSKGHLPGSNIFLYIPVSAADADVVNPIKEGPFWGCSRMWGVPNRPRYPKICLTYPALMKLGTVIP